MITMRKRWRWLVLAVIATVVVVAVVAPGAVKAIVLLAAKILLITWLWVLFLATALLVIGAVIAVVTLSSAAFKEVLRHDNQSKSKRKPSKQGGEKGANVMNRKYYWIGVILLMLLWFGPRILRKLDRTVETELRFKDAPKQINFLKQLQGSYVVDVDFPPSAEEYGLTEQALRNDVEQRFRQYGVKISSGKDYKRAFVSGKKVSFIKVYPSIYEENGTVIVEIEGIQLSIFGLTSPRK